MKMTYWIPLFLFPLSVVPFKGDIPAWLFMVLFSMAIFMGFKWLSFKNNLAGISQLNFWKAIGYLFLWPGMDTKTFFNEKLKSPNPKMTEWAGAFVKTVLGAVLIWGFLRYLPIEFPTLIGWSGILGLLILFHFGVFHIFSLTWRAMGFNAQPIMDFPLKAASLSDFWSNRWNKGFRLLTHDLLFVPLFRKFGLPGTILIVFFMSGLIHELAISYPAGDGYGLPSLYFVLQGLGILFERSIVGKWLGTQRGFKGWLFAFVVIVGPAYILFHPPFMKNVIVPFMNALGAI